MRICACVGITRVLAAADAGVIGISTWTGREEDEREKKDFVSCWMRVRRSVIDLDAINSVVVEYRKLGIFKARGCSHKNSLEQGKFFNVTRKSSINDD